MRPAKATTVDRATIMYDGVEIPDFGDRHFPYGIIEVTRRCNLRCDTCFFFKAFQHQDDDLPEEVLVDLRGGVHMSSRSSRN